MRHLFILHILYLSIAYSQEQETITFTNCGQVGMFDPSQEQCNSEHGVGGGGSFIAEDGELILAEFGVNEGHGLVAIKQN